MHSESSVFIVSQNLRSQRLAAPAGGRITLASLTHDRSTATFSHMNGPVWIYWQLPKYHPWTLPTKCLQARRSELHRPSPALLLPASLSFSAGWEGNAGVRAHIHSPLPSQHWGDRPVPWFAGSFCICPTLTYCSVRTDNPLPFHVLCGGHFSRAAHHFLIKQYKRRITRDTAQPCWDFTLSAGCKCPYNVGFFNLVLLLPAAAIQSAENKAPRLSGPTQWLCAFASSWTNNTSVSALLETFLLWESDCVCPSAQATQRCESVPTNSAVVSGARASAAAYRTDVKACGQLPASPACPCEPLEGHRYGPTEPVSHLHRSTRGSEAEQNPSVNNYVHLCINSDAGSYRSLRIYDVTMKMSKLHLLESCSYMKSWLPLKTKELEILTFARQTWKAEQPKEHKLECKWDLKNAELF